MARVVWSSHAREQLRDIRHYIARYDAQAAGRVVRHLLRASRHLELFPRSGRVVPEYDRPDIREIIVNPYRVLYRVDAARERVEIVTVWHGARLLSDVPSL